jgi:hypothetical protein
LKQTAGREVRRFAAPTVKSIRLALKPGLVEADARSRTISGDITAS